MDIDKLNKIGNEMKKVKEQIFNINKNFHTPDEPTLQRKIYSNQHTLLSILEHSFINIKLEIQKTEEKIETEIKLNK